VGAVFREPSYSPPPDGKPPRRHELLGHELGAEWGWVCPGSSLRLGGEHTALWPGGFLREKLLLA
jgi:hypothetical protein